MPEYTTTLHWYGFLQLRRYFRLNNWQDKISSILSDCLSSYYILKKPGTNCCFKQKLSKFGRLKTPKSSWHVIVRQIVSDFLHDIGTYLRNIWSKCLANDAKSNDKVMTRPPTTAVNRTLFLRHSATRNGAERWETAKLVEPIQTEKNKCK